MSLFAYPSLCQRCDKAAKKKCPEHADQAPGIFCLSRRKLNVTAAGREKPYRYLHNR